jgi:hypothetical protein
MTTNHYQQGCRSGYEMDPDLVPGEQKLPTKVKKINMFHV